MVFSQPQADPLCAGIRGWMMPAFADLSVLYHCLTKTNGLQLGSHGCTLWSGAGETISSFSHISGSQRLQTPRGFLPGGSFSHCPAIHPASLLQQKQLVILVTTAPALDVSAATFISSLATEWVCGMTQLLVAFLPLILLLSSAPFTQLHPQQELMIFLTGQERPDSFLWCPISVLPLCLQFFPRTV